MACRAANRLGEALDRHQSGPGVSSHGGPACRRSPHAQPHRAGPPDVRGLDAACGRAFRAGRRPSSETRTNRSWAATAMSNVARPTWRPAVSRKPRSAAQQALVAHRTRDNRAEMGNVLYASAELHCEQGEFEQASAGDRGSAGYRARRCGIAGWRASGCSPWAMCSRPQESTATPWPRTSGRRCCTGGSGTAAGRRWPGGAPGRRTCGWAGTRRAPTSTGRRRPCTRELGDRWNRAVELHRWAEAVVEDNAEAAHGHWREALTLAEPYGDPRAVALRGGSGNGWPPSAGEDQGWEGHTAVTGPGGVAPARVSAGGRVEEGVRWGSGGT